MKFKLDENLPELVRVAMNELGHDAHTVAEERLSGARDETVLQACVVEDRILITLDLDFSFKVKVVGMFDSSQSETNLSPAPRVYRAHVEVERQNLFVFHDCMDADTTLPMRPRA